MAVVDPCTAVCLPPVCACAELCTGLMELARDRLVRSRVASGETGRVSSTVPFAAANHLTLAVTGSKKGTASDAGAYKLFGVACCKR